MREKIVLTLLVIIVAYLYLPDKQTQPGELPAIPIVKPDLSGQLLVPERPDFSLFADVREKKMAYFNYIGIIAEIVNRRLLAQRKMLRELTEREYISLIEQAWLNEQALRYKVTATNPREQVQKLLLRMDVVPTAFVQIQTANESGWGTSRFATEGFNYYGLWCFTQGCGFVPAQRDTDKGHEVRKFADAISGMQAYMHNLNTHPAYQEFRVMRQAQREKYNKMRTNKLFTTLHAYSQRGDAYIDELQAMFRVNRDYLICEDYC